MAGGGRGRGGGGDCCRGLLAHRAAAALLVVFGRGRVLRRIVRRRRRCSGRGRSGSWYQSCASVKSYRSMMIATDRRIDDLSYVPAALPPRTPRGYCASEEEEDYPYRAHDRSLRSIITIRDRGKAAEEPLLLFVYNPTTTAMSANDRRGYDRVAKRRARRREEFDATMWSAAISAPSSSARLW